MHTVGDFEPLGAECARLVTTQKNDGVSDIIHRRESLLESMLLIATRERHCAYKLARGRTCLRFAQLIHRCKDGADTLAFDRARIDGINPDPLRTEL